jgi:tight adherence protein B
MTFATDNISLILSIVNGIIVVFVFLVLQSGYEDTVSELQAQQLSEGDKSLAELYISLNPQQFFFIRVALFILFFGLGFVTIGLVLSLMLGTFAYFVPQFLLSNLKRKRVKKVETQLVEGLELLGNSLKSGLTLPQAVELLVREFPKPISQEFTLVLSETRLGVDFTQALRNMATRLNSNVIHVLASGISINKRCGGDLPILFQNISTTIREQANIEGKLDAVTAQGRFQGLILGLMPFALIVILYFVDRTHVETLFRYQFGIWAVAGVVVMVGMAQLWIRKLLAIDV